MSNYPDYVTTLAGHGYSGIDDIADMADDAILGDMSAEELGRRVMAARSGHRATSQQRAAALALRSAGRSGAPQGMPISQLVAPIAGVPSRGLRKSWLPFAAALTFISTVPTNPQNLTIQPQKPFRATRQLYTVARTGATATGLLQLNGLDIGANRQQAGIGVAPLDGFGPTAFDVDVDLDPASTSINVVAQVQTSLVPTAPDNLVVAGMLVGYMVG